MQFGPEWLMKRFHAPSLTGIVKYSKQQLLALHKPTQCPEEFNAHPILISKESLTPVSLLPVELQEEVFPFHARLGSTKEFDFNSLSF